MNTQPKPTVGQRLIEAAKQARAIARGEAEPASTLTAEHAERIRQVLGEDS